MTPERIAELRQTAHEMSLFGLGGVVTECLDELAAQQREIDGLLGLLMEETSGGFYIELLSEQFPTLEAAKAAVRAAWEGQ